MPDPRASRVVLAGFMGCGKTTVGRLLAADLRWTFVDLDAEIERLEGRSIAAIFRDVGEAHFRAREAEILARLLQQQEVVIALGGGAPGSLPVRELLGRSPQTLVVHLDAPFPVLYERCLAQSLDPAAAVRPLLGDREQAQARFELRRPFYHSVAHHTVTADHATPAEVSRRLRDLLAHQDFTA